MDTSKIGTKTLQAEITGTASGTLQATITDEDERTVGVLVLSGRKSEKTGSVMFWGQAHVVVDGMGCNAQTQVVVNNSKFTGCDLPDVTDGEVVGFLSLGLRTSQNTGSAMWWGQAQVVVGGTPCSAQTQVVISHSKNDGDKNSRKNGPVVSRKA